MSARAKQAKDPKALDWPEGIIWKKHKRKTESGEIEEIEVPYMRVRYRGEDGKRHAVLRQVESPSHAKRVRTDIAVKFETEGEEAFAHVRTTFEDLAKLYETHYLKPAVFAEDRKISGMRSFEPLKGYLRTLREHFGKRRLRAITVKQLEIYKVARLATPVTFKRKPDAERKNPKRKIKKPPTPPRARSITSVNRELQLLRAMLNVAVDENWLRQSPFSSAKAKGLIDIAAERQRERIVSPDEEAKLLAMCDAHEYRKHLRPFLVCAIDTGMRFAEVRRLTWQQVNFADGMITIISTHTKILRARRIKMTARLQEELENWHALGKVPVGSDDLVFGIKSNIKSAWTTIRTALDLLDVRMHDLRHTNATRLERTQKVSLAQLSRWLGHTNIKTTFRYVNQDDAALEEAAGALDVVNEKNKKAVAAAEPATVN
jgi:integrase